MAGSVPDQNVSSEIVASNVRLGVKTANTVLSSTESMFEVHHLASVGAKHPAVAVRRVDVSLADRVVGAGFELDSLLVDAIDPGDESAWETAATPPGAAIAVTIAPASATRIGGFILDYLLVRIVGWKRSLMALTNDAAPNSASTTVITEHHLANSFLVHRLPRDL